MDSTGISFTALFTGHVWYEHGMSARFFTSPKGQLLHRAAQPVEAAGRKWLGITVEDMLLQRHHIIDHLIQQRVTRDGVTQILEIACGYSPRGYKLSRKYPQLSYVEADLPHMALRKRTLLQQHRGFGPQHQVIACDVFAQGRPLGLDYIFTEVLDPQRPTLIITEGLVNYFSLQDISQVWTQLASLGQVFPKAWYLTDLVPKPDYSGKTLVHAATKMLSLATRASVNLHFNGPADIKQGMLQCGFNDVTVYQPEQFRDQLPIPLPPAKSRINSIVRVLECQIHSD
ncbi:MAG: class I SAM-dependent methyltransferase [Pseudomonadota bacterium]|nr:class I SAM-dependent methyltransferase [Pseudomonadota bacterium]